MITAREIYGHGLITGLSVSEMLYLKPGFILDMLLVRQKYLKKLFGFKNKDDSI